MEDKTRVFNEDCLPAMREFKDKYFDLAIVDPPYGINEGNRIRSKTGLSKAVDKRNGAVMMVKTDRYKRSDWDESPPPREYFDQLVRISKNQIVWGINNFDVWLGPGLIVWDKINGTTNFSDAEVAFCSLHKSTRLFRYLWNGMMQGTAINSEVKIGNVAIQEKRIHKTQKPVKLYQWLFKNYAKEGDKILDTHLGSQSSRIVAYDLGFDFTGYELDKDHFKDGCKRFEEFKAQTKIQF